MNHPAVREVQFFLAHTPGLVQHGSKPARELAKDSSLGSIIAANLRSYSDAVGYAPHQTLLGNLSPDSLGDLAAPWYENPLPQAFPEGPHGQLVDEEEFYGLLKLADDFDLIWLEEGFVQDILARLQARQLVPDPNLKRLRGVPGSKIEERLAQGRGALPLNLRDGRLVGLVQTDYDEDSSLSPDILLENLAVKATATMALRSALARSGTDPESLQYVIGSGEEAIGDRYQRGGGNLGKTVAEAVGCLGASGSDIKAFCCGPVHAIIMAGALVASGVFPQIAVVGGCSLAKLGMKFQGHLAKEIPIMEDLLVGFALLLGPDDGQNPIIRLDGIGRHTVAAGSVQQKIMEALVQSPLEAAGLGFKGVGKYATELHNPEITDTTGSGNVPRTNYRLIAALAARKGEIPTGSEARDEFVARHGMPGFSPTQGHIASAVPYLAHALDRLRRRDYQYSLFLAKGSLFLGRMTHMSDGASFLLETNPATA